MRFSVSISGRDHALEITQTRGTYQLQVDGRPIHADIVWITTDTLSILWDGQSYTARMGTNGGILIGERSYEVSVVDPRSWRSRHPSAAGGAGRQKLTASMPGKVVRVLTSAGSQVRAGQGVVVIEAMKMQNEIRAPRDGTVTSILVHEGDAVNAGDAVAVLE